MKQINLRKTGGLVALVVLLPTLAFAFGGQGRGGGQNSPPQAAIDACFGRNAGDMVEFLNRRNETVSGTCQGQNGTMFAVPANRQGGKGGRSQGGQQTMSGSDSGQNDWRGGQRQNRRDMVADLIGLSEDQQAQITAIREEERNSNVAQREKMEEYREQIWALTDAGTFDEQAVRAIAEQKAEIQIEMAVSRARMHSRIHALMTPEQQELATKLRATRKDRRGKSQRGQGGGRR